MSKLNFWRRVLNIGTCICMALFGFWLMTHNYGNDTKCAIGFLIILFGIIVGTFQFAGLVEDDTIPFRNIHVDTPPPPRKLLDGRRVIKVSGRNWGYIFSLPCILEISKRRDEDGGDRSFATLDCAQCVWYAEGTGCVSPYPTDDCDHAHIGDSIIEYQNGRWGIKQTAN